MPQMTITPVSSPLKAPFAIARGSKTSAETIVVEIVDGPHRGRGEAVPYARYGENCARVISQLNNIKSDVNSGLNREDLQLCLSPGAARCAVDCALWDLEAKQTGIPVWQRAGLPKPRPMACTMSLSLDTPAVMAKTARETPAKTLKLKLGDSEDLARIKAVHAIRPDAKIIIDGNEGLDPEAFPELIALAADLGVILIEQPFPVGADDILLHCSSRIGICADESVHTWDHIQDLAKLYDAVNIKLDKAGGLTEALKMVEEARKCGLGIMIGCMIAGSLSMAPAVLLGGAGDIIDLDGPLWLDKDIEYGLRYDRATVAPPSPKLWG